MKDQYNCLFRAFLTLLDAAEDRILNELEFQRSIGRPARFANRFLENKASESLAVAVAFAEEAKR